MEVNKIKSSTIFDYYSDTDQIEANQRYIGNQTRVQIQELVCKYGQILRYQNLIREHHRWHPMHLELKIVSNLLPIGWSNSARVRAKKDGSTRTYSDYRQMNAVTENITYLISDTQLMLDGWVDRKFYSSIDPGQAKLALKSREVMALARRAVNIVLIVKQQK